VNGSQLAATIEVAIEGKEIKAELKEIG